MLEQKRPATFRGPLAKHMSDFISEKHALGYKYDSPEKDLLRFDKFLAGIGRNDPALTKEVVESWIRKGPDESPNSARHRIHIARQIGKFLLRRGIEAYIPSPRHYPLPEHGFAPYIFTRDEIGLFLSTADNMRPHHQSPLCHIVVPLVFRLLYCCGLRLGEVIHLRVADVDLKDGVLTVRNGKFRKDRLVPMAQSLIKRLRDYANSYRAIASDSDFFLPAPDGGPYSSVTMYCDFRMFLRKCNIPHAGKGKGPRIHDIRHTFAVHRLHDWYCQGVDLNIALPILSAYMGHADMFYTQQYLHLTSEVYPDLVQRMSESLGHIIPRGIRHETN